MKLNNIIPSVDKLKKKMGVTYANTSKSQWHTHHNTHHTHTTYTPHVVMCVHVVYVCTCCVSVYMLCTCTCMCHTSTLSAVVCICLNCSPTCIILSIFCASPCGWCGDDGVMWMVQWWWCGDVVMVHVWWHSDGVMVVWWVMWWCGEEEEEEMLSISISDTLNKAERMCLYANRRDAPHSCKPQGCSCTNKSRCCPFWRNYAPPPYPATRFPVKCTELTPSSPSLILHPPPHH